MGKAIEKAWEHNQTNALNSIYTMVLKYGWSVKLDEVRANGAHIFELTGENPTRKEWTEDWQFHELPHFQQRRVTLMPQGEAEEWMIN